VQRNVGGLSLSVFQSFEAANDGRLYFTRLGTQYNDIHHDPECANRHVL